MNGQHGLGGTLRVTAGLELEIGEVEIESWECHVGKESGIIHEYELVGASTR
jgi:hypothetical protein